MRFFAVILLSAVVLGSAWLVLYPRYGLLGWYVSIPLAAIPWLLLLRNRVPSGGPASARPPGSGAEGGLPPLAPADSPRAALAGSEFHAARPGSPPAVPHAILKLMNQNAVESTRFVVTDISKARLWEGLLGSQLAFGLDIRTADQVDELLSTGRTETTGVLGVHFVVTLEWCACDTPASHRLGDALQLG